LNNLQNLTVRVASRIPKDERAPDWRHTYLLNPHPNSIEYADKVYAVLCYNLPKLVRLGYLEGRMTWRREVCLACSVRKSSSCLDYLDFRVVTDGGGSVPQLVKWEFVTFSLLLCFRMRR
jgi:hypothetical protein